MPFIGGGVLLLYPALMQVAFSFAAVLGLIQATLFRQPWVRAKLGIQPLPSKKSNARLKATPYSGALSSYEAPTPTRAAHTISSQQGSKGLISSFSSKARNLISRPASGMKGAASEVRKAMNQYRGTTGTAKKKHGRTAAELQDAKRYEERHRRQQSASQQPAKKSVQ